LTSIKKLTFDFLKIAKNFWILPYLLHSQAVMNHKVKQSLTCKT